MRRVTLTICSIAAVALSACGSSTGDDGGAPTDTGGEGATVELVDFDINAPATVAAGTSITVVNAGETTHNWTATDGGFATDNLASGDEATVTLEEPGTYEYRCTIHPAQMNGSLEVE